MSDAKTDAGEQRQGGLEYLSGNNFIGDLEIVQSLLAIAIERRVTADDFDAQMLEATLAMSETMKAMVRKPIRRADKAGLHPMALLYVESYDMRAEAKRAEARAQTVREQLTAAYTDKRVTVTTLGVDPSKLVIVRDDELGTARDVAAGHIGGFEVAAKGATLYVSDGRGLYFVEVFDAEGQPQIDVNFGSEDS